MHKMYRQGVFPFVRLKNFMTMARWPEVTWRTRFLTSYTRGKPSPRRLCLVCGPPPYPALVHMLQAIVVPPPHSCTG